MLTRRPTFSCEYLAKVFCDDVPKGLERSVCICDDDNDIEMALACSHAFIPALSSESMQQVIENNPDKFTMTFSPGVEETVATEAALQFVVDKATAQRK